MENYDNVLRNNVNKENFEFNPNDCPRIAKTTNEFRNQNVKKKNYNDNVKNRKKSTNKKIKKTCSIAIAIATTASLIATGYCLKRQNEIEGYIEKLPEGFKVGSFVSKNEKIKRRYLKDDFLLIEVPDYTESIEDKSKFSKNVAECIAQGKDFGFYINTDAKTEEELDAIIYRLNAITKDKHWISNYPLYVEFNTNEEVTTKTISNLVNIFNKKLIELNWMGVFVLNGEYYENLENKETINVHLITENKQVDNQVASYSYNTGLLGSVFGDSSIKSIFDSKIYTKDFREFIKENGLNQNEFEEYYIGIDISEFQGKIDWMKTKNEIDFAILRICDFKNYHSEKNSQFLDIVDKQFEINLQMCSELDIPFGFYYYPRATTEEEIRVECEILKKYLNSKKMDFRNRNFFIDIESYNNKVINNMLSDNDETIVKMVNIFCTEMSKEGYTAGLYINESDLNKFNGILGGLDLTSKCPVWCAKYGQNHNFYYDININEYGNICDYTVVAPRINEAVNLWGQQFTDNGHFIGITENTVDVNMVPKQMIKANNYLSFGKNNS